MANKTNVEVTTENTTRYRSPDGMIFFSREEYLDYMEGLRS